MSVNYYDKGIGELIKIAGNANGAIDDSNVSNKTTYSSEKIANSLTEKANDSDLTSHISDTVVHITPTERDKWNNKTNGEDIIKKTDIKATLDKDSTNTDICSGKAIYDAIKKSCVNYSTDEQLTGGTWIDGKPIYRKVIILDVSSGDGHRIEINSLNVEQLILLRGIFNDTQYNYMSPVPAYVNDNTRFYMSYDVEDSTLYYESGKIYGVNGKLIVIIEYTKKN